MATMTYEELQTESLITFSFSALTSNFKTVDSFIKNFSHFQRSAPSPMQSSTTWRSCRRPRPTT